MSKAKGPPCIRCGRPVSARAVPRCPWCRMVVCFKCDCPNKCAEQARLSRGTRRGSNGE